MKTNANTSRAVGSLIAKAQTKDTTVMAPMIIIPALILRGLISSSTAPV